MTPSRRRRRDKSSESGGRLDLRGARPGGGKTQSMPARTQFEHGDRLLHRTFRRRQVIQLRALGISGAGWGAVAGRPARVPVGECPLAEEEFGPSGEAEGNDMTATRGIRDSDSDSDSNTDEMQEGLVPIICFLFAFLSHHHACWIVSLG